MMFHKKAPFIFLLAYNAVQWC